MGIGDIWRAKIRILDSILVRDKGEEKKNTIYI